MKLLFLSLILAYLSSHFVSASNEECDLGLKPQNIQGFHYVSKSGKLSCRHLEAVFKDINKVNTLTLHLLNNSAPETHILFAKEGDNAYFDRGLLFHFPQQFSHRDMFGNRLGSGATFYEVRSIATHEYAHRLYEEYIKERLQHESNFVEWFELAEKHTRIKLALIKFEEDEEKVQRLNEERIALNKKLMENEKLTSFSHLASRYHEFVADVIAVYKFHDKSIVTDALTPKYYDDNFRTGRTSRYRLPKDAEFMGQRAGDRQNYVESRDFESYSYELNERNYGEPHAFYFKVRRFVGRHMWPEYKDIEAKRRYLTIIFEETFNDLLENFSNPRNDIDQIQLNNELIGRIQKRLNR